jgi:hypothetical protein
MIKAVINQEAGAGGTLNLLEAPGLVPQRRLPVG